MECRRARSGSGCGVMGEKPHLFRTLRIKVDEEPKSDTSVSVKKKKIFHLFTTIIMHQHPLFTIIFPPCKNIYLLTDSLVALASPTTMIQREFRFVPYGEPFVPHDDKRRRKIIAHHQFVSCNGRIWYPAVSRWNSPIHWGLEKNVPEKKMGRPSTTTPLWPHTPSSMLEQSLRYRWLPAIFARIDKNK